MKRLNLAVIIGGAAILLGLSLIVFKNMNADRIEYPAISQENKVLVQDQRADNVVTVDTIILEKPGFAAVHEANGSRLGKLVGVSLLLAPGENRLVFINATTTKNKEYFVALYGDNGNSAFSERNDDLLKIKNEEAKAKFKAL